MPKYDFSGYATKVNLKCSDGRTIMKNAFKENDGQTVPLVWQHLRNDPTNVLGHAMLENREDGVYAYCKFNDTDAAKTARELVQHGDIKSLSIYANQLVQRGGNVTHGMIREVSLVLAGANPGALIDNLSIQHGDDYETLDDEAIIYTGLSLQHADENQNGRKVPSSSQNDEGDDGETVQDVFNSMNEKQKNVVYFLIGQALQGDSGDDEAEQADYDEGFYHADEEDDGETVQDVFNSMTEKQKNVAYFLVGQALESAGEEEDDEDDDMAQDAYDDYNDYNGGYSMKRNVFDAQDTYEANVLSHADIEMIFSNAKKFGSLREAVKDFTLEHSITGTEGDSFPEDVLFPDARTVTPTPEMIMRQQEWVSKVWNATKKSPFSRIKSTAANLTADEARAKGYIKGKKKQEEVITMLKRVTTPQTVYKLQKMDRDDIIDITDFDIVAWLKAEMRLMLNEELSRAILVGDGRTPGAEDKINESNIRPVWKDDDLYTIKYTVPFESSDTDDVKADKIITAAHRARKDYMGSGSPVLYTDTDTITTLLLAKDKVGRRLYNTMAELASALRVREIVEVPILEGLTREARPSVPEESDKTFGLLGLIVNLSDYNIGADKGGAVSMFDDFDIDYNKYTYLIETRCSGALTRPYSAIALEYVASGE